MAAVSGRDGCRGPLVSTAGGDGCGAAEDDGAGGRPSFPAETMRRIHFMQQWFALSDPGMEEALHDSPAIRTFAWRAPGKT